MFFAARKDLLCAQIINHRWQNTLEALKSINKGGSKVLPEPKLAQKEMELETEAALYRLIELIKTET